MGDCSKKRGWESESNTTLVEDRKRIVRNWEKPWTEKALDDVCTNIWMYVWYIRINSCYRKKGKERERKIARRNLLKRPNPSQNWSTLKIEREKKEKKLLPPTRKATPSIILNVNIENGQWELFFHFLYEMHVSIDNKSTFLLSMICKSAPGTDMASICLVIENVFYFHISMVNHHFWLIESTE